jgi:small conductance mechanosensitive channel
VGRSEEKDMEAILSYLRDLIGQGREHLPGLAAAILIFVSSLIVARVASRAVARASRKADVQIRNLLTRLVTMTTLVVGAVVALDQVGVNVGGLVAGLGLLGFTLGFALQDIGKNLVSGVLLLVQRPFEIGDNIEVAGYGGTVTDIDVRATSIKAWDGLQVIIPNADVYSNSITNYNTFPPRRGQLTVAVGYEEDLPQVMDIFLDAVRGVPDVLAEPAPAVYCSNLGTSGVEVDTYFWIDQGKSSMLEATSRAVMALKEAAAAAGINLPYPIQTVRVRRTTEGEPL